LFRYTIHEIKLPNSSKFIDGSLMDTDELTAPIVADALTAAFLAGFSLLAPDFRFVAPPVLLELPVVFPRDLRIGALDAACEG
jgi:hypothetical protein